MATADVVGALSNLRSMFIERKKKPRQSPAVRNCKCQ
jgi:hypothetical protein